MMQLYVEGYKDPGFTLQGVQGRSFGGLIGTGLGASWWNH